MSILHCPYTIINDRTCLHDLALGAHNFGPLVKNPSHTAMSLIVARAAMRTAMYVI